MGKGNALDTVYAPEPRDGFQNDQEIDEAWKALNQLLDGRV